MTTSHTHAFHAMGTTCTLTLHAAAPGLHDRLAAAACLLESRARSLEACWTRFSPDSDLSLLNAHAGHGPLTVSDDLWTLVTRMSRAWLITDGLYDPTIAPSLRALGYDVTFTDITRNAALAATSPSPGLHGLALDPRERTVALPSGVQIDPGGIGKGLAGDMLASDAASLGLTGALIDLGGDLVGFGRPGPDRERWIIAVRDERDPDGAPLATLDLPAGRFAVATSSTAARRWGPRRRAHHIIDPSTGGSARLGLSQATVVPAAALGWVAEAYATAALLRDSQAPAWLSSRPVLASVLQTHTGQTTGTGVASWKETRP